MQAIAHSMFLSYAIEPLKAKAHVFQLLMYVIKYPSDILQQFTDFNSHVGKLFLYLCQHWVSSF